MLRHAKTQHPDEWKKANEGDKNQKTIVDIFSPKSAKIQKQKYKPDSVKRKALNEKLVRLIAKDMRPLSVVQNKGFREFVAELDPLYKLPSTKTLREKLIPRIYNKSMNGLLNELKSIDHIALTTDGWTSSTADKYQVYTVHYINWSKEEPSIQSKILECAPYEERSTIIELEKDLTRVTSKYDIKSKLCLCVADNATDIQGALKLFGIPKVGCAAHKFNLCAQTIIVHLPVVKNLKKKVSDLVRTTKVSPKAKKILLQCLQKVGIKGKKALVSYVETRWNTVYLMFVTAIEMKDALVLYFAEQNLDKDNALNDQDWKLMGEITKVLRALYLVTLEVSAEKVSTLSKVIPIVNLLLETYSNEKPDETKVAKECRKLIFDAVTKQFDGFESNETYACATILDPRFKNVPFSTKTKGNQAVNYAKSNAVAIAHANEGANDDESTDDFEEEDESTKTKVQSEFDELWSNFDAKTAKPLGRRKRINDHMKDCVDVEMSKYLMMPKIDRKNCPILWWKNVGQKQYPMLFESAKKFLPMPATSVPSERAFSAAGNVLTKRRNKLGKETANQLITLHKNME